MDEANPIQDGNYDTTLFGVKASLCHSESGVNVNWALTQLEMTLIAIKPILCVWL